MTDTYTARQAADIIGRSERLVRKLAEDGRLEIIETKPLRLSQESVHRERSRRKGKPDRKPDGSGGLSAEMLEQIVTRSVAVAVAEALPRMLESRDRSEQMLQESLAEARAEIEQLRRDLNDERSRPALRLPPVGWPFRR